MKKGIRYVSIILFFVAAMGNVIVFISSMKLAEETHRYEQLAYTLQRENTELEKEMSGVQSIKYALEYKDKWGFKKMINPVTIGELQFALRSSP